MCVYISGSGDARAESCGSLRGERCERCDGRERRLGGEGRVGVPVRGEDHAGRSGFIQVRLKELLGPTGCPKQDRSLARRRVTVARRPKDGSAIRRSHAVSSTFVFSSPNRTLCTHRLSGPVCTAAAAWDGGCSAGLSSCTSSPLRTEFPCSDVQRGVKKVLQNGFSMSCSPIRRRIVLPCISRVLFAAYSTLVVLKWFLARALQTSPRSPGTGTTPHSFEHRISSRRGSKALPPTPSAVFHPLIGPRQNSTLRHRTHGLPPWTPLLREASPSSLDAPLTSSRRLSPRTPERPTWRIRRAREQSDADACCCKPEACWEQYSVTSVGSSAGRRGKSQHWSAASLAETRALHRLLILHRPPPPPQRRQRQAIRRQRMPRLRRRPACTHPPRKPG